jgi:hypothetical protein
MTLTKLVWILLAIIVILVYLSSQTFMGSPS